MSQSLVLSWASLCGIRSRAVSSAVAVLGFAGVATMLVVLLSGPEAIRAMYEFAGRDDVVVLMSGTSTWEAGSFIPPELIPELERLPGIVRVDGQPEISKELTSSGSARLPPEGNGKIGRTVSARGVTPAAFRMRQNFHIVKGRAFDSARHQMFVGRALWADTLGPADSDGATYVDSIASNTQAIVDGLTGGEVACRPSP